MREKHIFLAFMGIMACGLSAIVGIAAAMQGSWLWPTINGLLFLVNAYLVVLNVYRARML